MDLAAGDYDVEILGFGPNSGANSLFMELDGTRMTDIVHLPERTVGVASRFVEQDPEAMPVLKVSTAGKHTLVLVLREGPPQTIDRVRIFRKGKAVATIEADTMLPMSPKP